MGIQDDELAGLSDEERAALSSEDDTGSEDAAEPVEAASEPEPADPAPEPVAEDNAEDPAPSVDAEDYDEPFVARYQADPVDGYDEKLGNLDAQFEAGEVTLKEYNAQRESLLKQQLKAEIAAEQRTQAEQQKWQWEIERFMEDNATYRQDPLLYAALDAAIKNLANQPDNSDKTGRWFLNEAHRQVQSRFSTPPAAKPAEKTGSKAAEVPRTLSSLPAAAENETGADEFAHIESLISKGKVVEAERLLAKLTPDQQTRYLEAAG
jgi:hypothetical protein